MTVEARVKAAEKRLDIGSGELWDGADLETISRETFRPGDTPLSPGAHRASIFIALGCAPAMICGAHPDRPWRDEWLRELDLTPEQTDRATIDRRCFELAHECGFSRGELAQLKKALATSWGHVAAQQAYAAVVAQEQAKVTAHPRPAPAVEPWPAAVTATAVPPAPEWRDPWDPTVVVMGDLRITP